MLSPLSTETLKHVKQYKKEVTEVIILKGDTNFTHQSQFSLLCEVLLSLLKQPYSCLWLYKSEEITLDDVIVM